MDRKLNAIAAILAVLFCVACTASAARSGSAVVAYPAVLQGVWQGDAPGCKLPGDVDSDMRLDIAANKISAYEDWSAPSSVVQISKAPQAWKIVSQKHVNEDSIRLEEIFLLSGEDQAALTIVNIDQAHTYHRCR